MRCQWCGPLRTACATSPTPARSAPLRRTLGTTRFPSLAASPGRPTALVPAVPSCRRLASLGTPTISAQQLSPHPLATRSSCSTALVTSMLRAMALPDPLAHRGGKIGQDHVRPCAPDPRQRLEHSPPLVEPPPLGGCLDHRVLPAHVVSGDGQRGILAEGSNHVEVRDRGLDHHDVGPLLLVQTGLAEGLPHVAGVLLIRALVLGHLPSFK
mmetsp:Transcript_86/g.223  ORF Transcript_86/g.223 Transcript_86/m.223 type:complete len:212 (+) Transcript_86:90-725(+)